MQARSDLSRPARVGVIGGGIWGEHHMRAALEQQRFGQVELVAMAARSKQTADRHADAHGIQGYTDYRRMLEEQRLDAVTVATPDHLHREMVTAALEAGCHVLVEKPMDTTVAGSLEMTRTAAARQRLLMVDFHKRYDPFVIDLREKVRNGRIGDLQYAYAFMEDQIVVPAEWLAGWAASSSPFWFLGVHKFDLLRWISGQEAVSVVAHGNRGKLTAAGIETYDSVQAHVVFDGGFCATIHTSWILPRTLDAVVTQGLRLVGTDGIAEMDARNRGLRYGFADDGIVTPNPLALREVAGPERATTSGYFIDPIKDFFARVHHVLTGGDLEAARSGCPSAVDGLRATQLAAAVETSLARGGEVVAIDDLELDSTGVSDHE